METPVLTEKVVYLDTSNCNMEFVQIKVCIPNKSIWSALFVKWTKKQKLKGHGPTLEETCPDHAINNAITVTQLLLGHSMLKKRLFFSGFFSLSGLVIVVHTAS